MKTCFLFGSAVLAVMVLSCDHTRATPSIRVRRQGWEWGGNQEIPPFPSSSERPFPTSSPPPLITTITTENNIAQCIATCPATPQYNPVCGTDNQIYNNEGRLNCARSCGQSVELLHLGTCSPNS